MREDVEIVAAYLDDLAEVRSRLGSWSVTLEANLAQQAARALRAHHQAVRLELIDLARVVLPGGAQLKERFDRIGARLLDGSGSLERTSVEDAPGVQAMLERALAEERELLVDDVLPMLIGSLEEPELRELQRSFKRRE